MEFFLSLIFFSIFLLYILYILIFIPIKINKLYKRVEALEKIIKINELPEPIRSSLSEKSTNLEYLVDQIQQRIAQNQKIEEIINSFLAEGYQISDIEKAVDLIKSSQIEILENVKQNKILLTERFIDWLKEDWLLKLGAFILLIAFSSLTTYAFLNNWIGPIGRVVLGIIAGIIFLLIGYWRIKNYLIQGSVFLILGSMTILISLFAARVIYHFFTPLPALIIAFLTNAFVAITSINYRSRILPLLSLILAGFSPIFVDIFSIDRVIPFPLWLFAYLLAIVLGTLWIVILTGQRVLITVSLIIVSYYSLPYFLGLKAVNFTLFLFGFIFSAIFFLIHTFGIIKLKDKKKEIVPDLITTGGNGLFLLAWILTALPKEWQSLVISLLIIIFAKVTFIIFKITQIREAFYVYSSVAIMMLVAATNIQLTGSALTISYIVEATLISLISYFILKDIILSEKLSLLLIVPMLLSIDNIISHNWHQGVFHEDFLVLFALGVSLLGLGIFFFNRLKKEFHRISYNINNFLLISGSFYLYILIWLSLHAALTNENSAVMIALIIYTIIGLIVYFYGIIKEKILATYYGAFLIAFVVLRLLLVDLWNMEPNYRIVTLFLIGILLISTAFWGRKDKIKKLFIKNEN